MILVKYIARAGILSRRKAEEAIRKREVKVNERIIIDPTFEVTENDTVYYKNKEVVVTPLFYIVLYKPEGFITSRSDPEKRPTVYELLPKQITHLVDPVGRLDFNTSGALLLSNDGDFVYKLSHPKFNISKKYFIEASKPLTKETIEIIHKGVKIEGSGVIRPDSIEWNSQRPCEVVITLHSGQYRVIRRLFEQVNIFVSHLHRLSFGSITLKGMAKGSWRNLTKDEIDHLIKI